MGDNFALIDMSMWDAGDPLERTRDCRVCENGLPLLLQLPFRDATFRIGRGENTIPRDDGLMLVSGAIGGFMTCAIDMIYIQLCSVLSIPE